MDLIWFEDVGFGRIEILALYLSISFCTLIFFFFHHFTIVGIRGLRYMLGLRLCLRTLIGPMTDKQ